MNHQKPLAGEVLEHVRQAGELRHHFLVDQKGDVCIRPSIFNDDGIEVLQPEPDAEDFIPYTEAVEQLQRLAQVRRRQAASMLAAEACLAPPR